MGHTDMLTICDAGLPNPEFVRRIDIAVVPGILGFLHIVRAITKDLKVQQITLADELRNLNPDMDKDIRKIFRDV